MLLGKSVFQSVLERVESESPEGEQEAAAATPFRVAGLTSGFVVDGSANEIPTADRVETAYLDFIAEEPRPDLAVTDKPLVMPSHLARVTPEEIAADLDLSGADTPLTLAEKRRAFARANHPDGIAEAFRENANIRMTIANQLIDGAMRRLERRR
ncbi:hypothetical protein MRS76_02205 [Rhizobiaceae bacterium n13]|uniref:Uncharacterized protein n=1 Tax=Ferirhizobium litorale TaxID=2927786 RepID=A0AAE3TZE7_9HYPH|nr:hypothetical protein [Fererhizobium litorale]MDI7860756.1 hypothetical protein [Fererhizobium litorale]MDI7920904.1 hypothetical protein [Fererhizobium litorale]